MQISSLQKVLQRSNGSSVSLMSYRTDGRTALIICKGHLARLKNALDRSVFTIKLILLFYIIIHIYYKLLNFLRVPPFNYQCMAGWFEIGNGQIQKLCLTLYPACLIDICICILQCKLFHRKAFFWLFQFMSQIDRLPHLAKNIIWIIPNQSPVKTR